MNCDARCQTCSAGASATSCLSCPSGAYLLSSNNSCIACNVDGYFISGYECHQCDSPCKTCSGTSTYCLTCEASNYLLQSNNSCVDCNVDGYFISGSECLQCDSPCKTCSGTSTYCLTCIESKYLALSSHTCVDCNVDGYFISGSQCLECDPTCLTCNGASTNCVTCESLKFLVPTNNSCVDCNVNGHFVSGSQCLKCDSTCLTCNGAPTACMTCVPSKYFVPTNNSCVDCNLDGYFISGSQCLPCDSTCKSCNGVTANNCTRCYQGLYLLTTNNSCTSCQSIPGYYADDINQTCSPKTTIRILKFELEYSPQLYLLNLDSPLDLEDSLADIKLYQISNSANLLITDMSEMSFTLTKLTPNSYQLNFLSYTESNETRSLLLSFDRFNLNSSYSYVVSPSNSTAPIFADSTVAQAAATVGTTSQAIAISAAVSTLLVYLQAKGASTQLMRILQVMARINFMKLININYLTPLASFYNYTDLGQFGLPNIFTKIHGFNNSQIATDSTFKTDSQGHIIFNDYFRYSFSQVFLDNYGGIVFSTCITLTLYLLVKVACKFFKNKNSKIKKILIAAGRSFEKSVIMTLIVSRYPYLCSALIFNYAYIPTNGAYQQISSGFAVLYTILIVFIWVLAICVSFYHGKNKAKLKPIRPLFSLITLLCQEYRSKTYLGRIMAFWTLLFNGLIMLLLELLRKSVIVQLSVLIVLNVITILFSIPKKVFKTTVMKITVIGTELGFIIISVCFLVMYSLENSNSYRARLGLSWTVVGVNLAIILFHILVKIVEFFRLKRKKKHEEQKQRVALQNAIEEDSQIGFRSSRISNYSVDLRSERFRIRAQGTKREV